MPCYEYICDQCGRKEEYIFTMAEVVDQVICCPDCDEHKTEMRRLITGGAGTIFRGSWPGKDIKRSGEDDKIKIARRQALRLKNSGAVPWPEQIKQDKAEGMHSRLGSEVRKKEIKKLEGLDKKMDQGVREE